MKPLIIRGARIADSTLKKYGEKYHFQTVESTTVDQDSLLIMTDEIEK